MFPAFYDILDESLEDVLVVYMLQQNSYAAYRIDYTMVETFVDESSRSSVLYDRQILNGLR